MNSGKSNMQTAAAQPINIQQGQYVGMPQEGGVGTQQQIDFTNFLQHANHPMVLLFTLLFKVIAVISFLFINLFLSNESLTFIIVVIFSAFDFWFVKNVSGR
jgi:hypothetical protein